MSVLKNILNGIGAIVLVGLIVVGSYLLTMPLKNSLTILSRVWDLVYRASVEMPDPETLPISREIPDTISYSRIFELRSMLEDRQFRELTSDLESYQRQFEADQTDEYFIYDAIKAFETGDPAHETLLQEWAAAFADRFPPYQALAAYYANLGWESRGTRWAKDTSEGQFTDMRAYFKKAREAATKALAINPDLMVAHELLIGIANADRNAGDEDALIEEALDRFPESFLIRSMASFANQPRWGGSYRRMTEIATAANANALENPKLSALFGFVYRDRANALALDKKYQQGLALADKAIEYGDHWSFYNDRAHIHIGLKNYEQALDDVNRALQLRPFFLNNVLLRAEIYTLMGNHDAALEDLSRAERLAPFAAALAQHRKWAGKYALSQGYQLLKTNPDESIEFFTMVLQYDQQNHLTYHLRGVAYAQSGNYALALADLRSAIALEPTYFESYRLVDYILMRDKDWNQIIHYWDMYIALVPDNPDAYYERSGTHFHNRDMARSIADLEKACDFGHKEACARLKQVRP